jgi:hypothetical protein
MGDGVFFTNIFNSMLTHKVFGKYMQYKMDGISGIWNNNIRQDGMGMLAARAFNPCYGDFSVDDFATKKVDEVSCVISMNGAVPFGIAVWADFHSRLETCHVKQK